MFWQLAKSFGLKVNGDAFLSISKSIDFSVIQKVKHDPHSLEALLLGQSGLLGTTAEHTYVSELKRV